MNWHRMLESPDAIGKLPIQRGVWYHVVTVFNGVHHRLFINGDLQDEQA